MRQGAKLIALVIVMSLAVSASLFVAPQSSRAQIPVTDVGLTVEQIQANILQNSVSTLDVIKNTITSVADVAASASEYALEIKAYVLDPIAFVLSGNALRAVTAGIV